MARPGRRHSRNVHTVAPHEGGTRATFASTFATRAALQQVLDVGVVEGATEAIDDRVAP